MSAQRILRRISSELSWVVANPAFSNLSETDRGILGRAASFLTELLEESERREQEENAAGGVILHNQFANLRKLAPSR